MKDKLLFILSLIIIISLSSCSKETVIEEETTTSITIATSKANLNLGETCTFTVTDNNGKTKSNGVVIYANDAIISGLSFTPLSQGSYAIHAKYSGISSNSINLEVTKLPASSISITASNSQLSIGQSVDFTVKDNYNADVTAEAEIFVDNVKLTGKSYTPTQKGSIEVYAAFSQLESTKQSLNVAKYAQKVLVEDYTGTWCGWCPRVANGIELVLEQSNNVIPVAIHAGDDPYDFADKGALMSAFGVTGFPTAKINRTETWSYPENSTNGVNQVLSKLQTEAPLGIGISSALSGTDLTIDVDIDFDNDLSGHKLIVYLIENKLSADQANYTDLYGGGAVLRSFEHNAVLRKCVTDLFGSLIPDSESVNGNTYQKSFSVDMSSAGVSVTENMQIVAFVVNSDDEAINVQRASVNETVTF